MQAFCFNCPGSWCFSCPNDERIREDLEKQPGILNSRLSSVLKTVKKINGLCLARGFYRTDTRRELNLLDKIKSLKYGEKSLY
jgi:hypothetical protein